MGRENIFIFGLIVQQIRKLRRKGYNPQDYINNSLVLNEIIGLIRNNFFSSHEHDIFNPITDQLLNDDHYLICADFDDYCATQERVSANFSDKDDWTRKSIINVAKSGRFSSDRTIKNYAQDIWKVPYSILR